MEENLDAPWWHAPLRGIAILLGLVALSGLLMGLIIGVARFLDLGERPAATYSAPITSETPAPHELNARTRTPVPYTPEQWPTYPGRGGEFTRPAAPAPRATPPKPAAPVGMSADEYAQAIASGKKIYLPNPSGECDVTGNDAAALRAIDRCFAARAAR